MKNYILILLLSIISTNSFSQRVAVPMVEEELVLKYKFLETTLTKESIIKFVKSIYINYGYYAKGFIKKMEDNMEFDKMYMEQRYVGQNFIIIPMKKVYFSQHAINHKNTPIQYVVVVEDHNDKGKVSRIDFILVYPKDKSMTVLPKNAFSDFSAQNTTQIDGTYTYVNFGDVKQFEIKVENGKRKQFKVWRGKKTGADNCKNWILETEMFNDNGSSTSTKENLGNTCTECPPGFKCDTLNK